MKRRCCRRPTASKRRATKLSRTRTLMLFRIRRVLTDEQNIKINAMHAKDRAEREKRSGARAQKGNNKGPGKDDHDHSDCQ